MTEPEQHQPIDVADIVGQVRTLVERHYVHAGVATEISTVLAQRLDRYPDDAMALAAAVTADLQSVNGDKHLRLVHHAEPLPERAPADDSEELAAMERWAARTAGGIARVERLDGNVGVLDLQPVLFPVMITGELMTYAMSLLAAADAIVVDLRHCLGGDPAMVTFIVSYLWDHEPTQLTGLRERGDAQPTQAWTLPYVPGRRPGKRPPAFVLTSGTTFSGGEQLSYDLQQLARATIVGARTGGGANARQGFRVHAHLEATISVAEAIHPVTGTGWEGTGVVPDVAVPADEALDVAYRLALQRVIAAGGGAADEAAHALRSLP